MLSSKTLMCKISQISLTRISILRLHLQLQRPGLEDQHAAVIVQGSQPAEPCLRPPQYQPSYFQSKRTHMLSSPRSWGSCSEFTWTYTACFCHDLDMMFTF